MKKAQAINTFNKGLAMDLNPVVTPNDVLTNALNATLITMNGNEFALQNDLGNGRVETAKLETGFVPVGVKEYGGIIYVASYNPITGLSQLGSFPSPERNLTQDEISIKQTNITDSDFRSNGEIKYYYKRLDVMPEDMYLNPGDKFGLFINGSPYNILSYYSDAYSKAVTLHPAILDDSGIINYIDEECKTNGKFTQGLIFGESINLNTIDGYNEAFSKLLVYKGKKSGRLVLIVELETLDDFVVSKSVSSIKLENGTGSSLVPYSDEENTDAKFLATFYNSGWPKMDNNYIKFKGVKFESSSGNLEFTTTNNSDTISYTLGEFTREDILKYKITPYTQLGPCGALARTGIINFKLYGTGNIIFNEWRYYLDNNKLRLNYGFDVNLLEGSSVKEISFEFYDVYYDVVYPNRYICKSSINGNYNGNYSEIFKLPYDLNYTETYSDSKNNKKYIYEDIIEKKILKANELIKNNFYCVRITATITGYKDSDGKKSQEDQKKYFYRFLWTTGYFNEEYINGNATNFSVLQVPDKYVPKFKLKAVVDKSDKSKYKIEYKNAPRTNGATNPYIYTAEVPETSEEIKANLYQDWELSKAQLTVTTEIEVPKDNSLFGDYNAGWFKLNTDKSEVTIKYDNSNQEILYPDGKPGTDPQKYVNLIKDDDLGEEDEDFKEYSKVLGSLDTQPYNLKEILEKPDSTFDDTYKNALSSALREKKITKDVYDNSLKALNTINDSQFYYLETKDVTFESKEKEDPTISFPKIIGRLIRRISGDTSKAALKSININELRPCCYQGMPEEDAKVLVAGSSYDNDKIFGTVGYAVLAGGNAGGNRAILEGLEGSGNIVFAYWGQAEGYVDGGTKLFRKYGSPETDGDIGLNYNETRRNLQEVAGNHSIYLIQSSNPKGVIDDDWGALGVGFYTDNSSYRPYNPDFEDSFKQDGTRTYTFKSIDYGGNVTIVLWRTNNSSDDDLHFVGINLGAVGNKQSYQTCVQTCITKLLKSIYILQSNTNRELYTQELLRMIYHSIFNTKIQIGLEVAINDGKPSIMEYDKTNSPIKLYDKGEGDVIFEEETIKARIKDTTEQFCDEAWELDSDVWYKDLENISGTPDVLQCSYLNIPYGKIIEPDEKNNAEREPISIDTSELIPLETDEGGNVTKYLLGINVELGNQMDISAIADSFVGYTIGASKTTPTFIYVPNGDSFKLESGVDSLGNPFNNKQVYYSINDGIYVPGNSESANKIDIFGQNSHCKLQNLFIPQKINNYSIPTINVNYSQSWECFSTNLSARKNRKHVSDIRMCKDIWFTNATYRPLKI